MEPEEEQPRGPGDEPDDDKPGPPWLPPDDRLWRHPSEVRANPALQNPANPGVAAGMWARRVELRVWALGLLSGAVGALVCAVVLLATGVVGVQQTVLTVKPVRTATPLTATTQVGAGAMGALAQVAPSVVGLSVNGAQGQVPGSGIIALTTNQYCYVVTDSALFQEAGPSSQVQVTSSTGEVKAGYLVGSDPSVGIAVVRVVFLPLAAQSPVDPGSVASVQTGEEIFSVGSAIMAGSSNGSYFAQGSIDDTMSYLQPVNGAADAMFSMMVADISVDPSAYGGPVVDGNGNVIGIINPVTGPSARAGETYVTPIDTAMADVSAMVKDGRPAAHPWLGVLQANDISGVAHVGPGGAVEVDTIASGSPAAKAGIADGDVITSVAGQGTTSVGKLVAWLANAKPGQVVSVDWLSGSRSRQSDITLGSQPATASPG